MSDQQKEKRYVTEWSFSFDELGDKISEFVRSLGQDGEEAIKQMSLAEAVGTATSAHVRLDLPVGETVVRTASAGNLIEGDLTYIGDIKFAVTGDAQKQVTLSQETQPADWVRHIVGWLGTSGKLKWNIGLTNAIPLDLDVHTGVGQSKFDLRDLHLTSLNVYGGTGEIELVLPLTSSFYNAQLNAGVGEFTTKVPAGASVDFKVRSGTGEVNIEVGEDAALNADIKGGVGATNIRVAANSAVRVEATMGLGEVAVPKSFTRIKGNGSFVGGNGVWQTPGFDLAERKVTIKFEGGVGSLVISAV